jgi:hypothetical protein
MMNTSPTTTAHGTAPERTTIGQRQETLVRQTATLARQLADVLLANVQSTASLNLTAVRALLARARIRAPAGLERRSDTWRLSWRTFEVCATSADQMLDLTRGHVERTTSALWRVTERLVDDVVQVGRVEELRQSFAALRAAQAAYWRATQQVHSDLIGLVQAPIRSNGMEAAHGTH